MNNEHMWYDNKQIVFHLKFAMQFGDLLNIHSAYHNDKVFI